MSVQRELKFYHERNVASLHTLVTGSCTTLAVVKVTDEALYDNPNAIHKAEMRIEALLDNYYYKGLVTYIKELKRNWLLKLTNPVLVHRLDKIIGAMQ